MLYTMRKLFKKHFSTSNEALRKNLFNKNFKQYYVLKVLKMVVLALKLQHEITEENDTN